MRDSARAPSDKQAILHAVETAWRKLGAFHPTVAAAAAADFLPATFFTHLQSLETRIAPSTPVLRSIHHFACTGGTLISRCIGSMPNTQVLSEIDPLSPLTSSVTFMPADLVSLTRFSSRPPARSEELLAIFLAGLRTLHEQSLNHGIQIVLRDHSHSYFCCGPLQAGRPTLRELLQQSYEMCSLVTVRHPLNSYLSLRHNSWVHFSPDTLEEYALRYENFLDHHRDLDIIRYEDFLAHPDIVMQNLCDRLALPFNPAFQELFTAIHLSGDSGRRGATISFRPRRPVAEALQAEASQSQAYHQLCTRLGYCPAPDRFPLPINEENLPVQTEAAL